MYRPAWVEIDLAAVRFNLRTIKAKVGSTKIMAVVKADAYGHGAVEVSRVALEEGAYALAVSNMEEALELRNAQFACPILILGWSPESCYKAAVENEITLAIFDLAEAQKLAQTAQALGKKAKVHLKVDTGMSRIGIMPDEEGLKTAAAIIGLKDLAVEGIFSHFAKADEWDKTYAYQQLERFNKFTALIEENTGQKFILKHIANSAAIMEMPEAYLDMVRAGIILYGNYPSKEVERADFPLKEAMSVKALVARVQKLPQGTTIGYGGTYRLSKDTSVATIPVGYADGYSRRLSNHGLVEYQGRLLKVIGNVCMDQFMVEIADDLKINVGDTVTVMGGKCPEISAESLADILGSISYEIDCLFKLRLRRIFKDEK